MRKLFSGLVAIAIVLIVCFTIGGISDRGQWQPLDSVVKLKAVSAYGNTWQGTGFFVADDLIMTAGHVVKDANEIWVIWPDDKKHKAVSWYKEDGLDLGVVHIRTLEKERTLYFADPEWDEEITAIGNPFGVFPHIAHGRITALGVLIPMFGNKELVLTDASLNPGNSGCPLFNSKNQIVGVHVGYRIGAENFLSNIPGPICRLVLEKYRAIQALQRAE